VTGDARPGRAAVGPAAVASPASPPPILSFHEVSAERAPRDAEYWVDGSQNLGVNDERAYDDRVDGNGCLAAHAVLGKLSWAMRSETGPVRSGNEDFADAFVPTAPDDAWDRGPLFVVADGMGGHAAGDVASRLAVEATLDTWSGGNGAAPQQGLRAAIRHANTAVYDASLAPGHHGMGTTVVALTVAGREAIIGHVGDSRAYLVRDAECAQLTADHSRVGEMVRMKLLTPEEAATHPARSQLTRSLGTDLGVQVDLTRQPVQRADTILLCTDGLWDVVSRTEMADAVMLVAGEDRPPPAAAVDRLVELAMARGASDNVTALTVTVTSALPIPAAAGRRFFRRGRS
jgi:PPM family protein phosphatase